jgi:hypothetical protein
MIGYCENPDEEPDRICSICDELLEKDLLDGWFCPKCENEQTEDE